MISVSNPLPKQKMNLEVKILNGDINVMPPKELLNCTTENVRMKVKVLVIKIMTRNVRLILVILACLSIIGIKRELEKRGIKTPTGKEKWSKND